MKYHERQALFRTHAAARLRRDSVETGRIEAIIWPDFYLPHQLFVFALFAAAVTERFSDDLDRDQLAEFTAGLRSARPGLHWLRAEALIRACFDESGLYLDVPQSEQPALMWAVLSRLVPPEASDDDLSALFDQADEFGRRVASRVFESERLFGWADEPEPEPGPEAEPEPEPDPEAPNRGETEAT